MTTTTTTSYTAAVASGAAPIPFTFQAVSTTEVAVLRNGVPQTYGVDFTVTLNGDNTGSIVPAVSWGTDDILVYSNPTYQQPSSFTRFGAFYPDMFNSVMDRIARSIIALRGMLYQTVRFPVGEVVPVLGDAAARAGKWLGFDSSGDLVLQDGPISSGSLSPEDHGAIGDGVANDTSAFQALAAEVMAAGGGVINLKPGATYLVGRQDFRNNGAYMFQAQDILTITGCSKAVIINGNGAKFKLAPGLKFGTFNADGTSHGNFAPFIDHTYYSNVTPNFAGIIGINTCTGPVTLRDIELDGNLANVVVGGNFGDTGWQVAGDGLMMFDNTGGELVENVNVYNFPRDGALGWRSIGNSAVKEPSVFRQFTSKGNGRQGFSLVGGRAYKFENCNFSDTGKVVNTGLGVALYSAPGAGVDLEAEGTDILREIIFEDCLFNNNTGAAMVSDQTNTEDVEFNRCTFIGSTSWAAWIKNAKFRFHSCTFVGAVNLPYQPTDPTLAPRFEDCKFSDDAALSPTGTVYLRAGLSTAGANPTYALCKRCLFDGGHHDHVNLGFGAILDDCTVTVASGSYTVGIGNVVEFRGRTNITGVGVGLANMPGALFGGIFTLNGTLQMRGSKTYDPPSLLNTDPPNTTTVTVPGAVLGQYARVSFDKDLQGIQLSGYVSAANTVTATFLNRTGGTIDLASGTLRAIAVNPDAT